MTKSILSAVGLCALVIFVFATMQNYGPQSAVRRFHEAVRARNSTELEDSIVRPDKPTRQDTAELDYAVNGFLNALPPGTTFSIRNSETIDARTVNIAAVYHTQDRAISAIWQVKKTPLGWKVDIHGTLVVWNVLLR